MILSEGTFLLKEESGRILVYSTRWLDADEKADIPTTEQWGNARCKLSGMTRVEQLRELTPAQRELFVPLLLQGAAITLLPYQPGKYWVKVVVYTIS